MSRINELSDSKSPVPKSSFGGLGKPAELVVSPIEAESPLSTTPSTGFLSPDISSGSGAGVKGSSIAKPTRRSSGLSYFSPNGTNMNSTPTTAAQHLMSDLMNNKESNLKDRIKKACSMLSAYLQNLLNEASFILYQVTDRIHKKLPKVLDIKKDIVKVNNQLSLVSSDMDDAKQVIIGLKEVKSLNNTDVLTKRAIRAATKLYNRKRR